MARQRFVAGQTVAVYQYGGRERYQRTTNSVWSIRRVLAPEVDRVGSEWRRRYLARPGGTYVAVVDERNDMWGSSWRPGLVDYVHNSRRAILSLEDYERDIAVPQLSQAENAQLLEERRAKLADLGVDIMVDLLMHATREVQREIVIANIDRVKLIAAAQKAGHTASD